MAEALVRPLSHPRAPRPPGLLGAAWFVARHDVAYLLRQRETLLWTFVMPPVFFFFIGTITGGFGGDGVDPEPLELRAGAGAGFLADELALRLERQDFRIVRSAADGSARTSASEPREDAARLALPAGFTDSVLAGRSTRVELTPAGEAGMEADYARVRVARAVYGLLGEVVLAAASGGPVTRAALQEAAREPATLRLEVRPAGRRREVPTGFEQAVPGTTVMFTLLVLLTSGAVLLVLERRAGLLRRLASSPLPRGGVVLGKWTGRMALGLVQIAAAVVTGTLLFGMRWGPDPAMVAVVLFAWAALAATFGLVLGNVARTEGQATALGVLGANLLAALGGCWWPIEITPAWMQRVALALPTGWTMDALHRLVSFEAGAASVLAHVAVLATAAAATGWLGTRTFRFL
ncbi:MAG: ABC transporter permease [Gemmatimonadota bacterium]